MAKRSKGAGELVARQMRQFQGKEGPGKRGRPKSRAQAIAIGLSEARAKGMKVPSPKGKKSRRGKKAFSFGQS